jgi:hypothetical protein
MDSRAFKTFTAPRTMVKTSVLAALREMEFPIESQETLEEGGERIIARVEGREVEVELESITPKTTKVKVVVREGWFWKDRATAEEIIEQASRDVDATVLASRGGGRSILPTTFPKPGPSGPPGVGELRAAPAVLDAWDPQRWREGFQAAPAPAKPPAPGGVPGQQPAGPAVSLSMIALAEGRSAPSGSEPVQPVAGRPQPVAPAPAHLAAKTPASADGREDNRWRVLRPLRLRQCPDPACPFGGPSLPKGSTLVRLWDKGEWWRVQIMGKDTIGWILAKDAAPQSWWDPLPDRSPATAAFR